MTVQPWKQSTGSLVGLACPTCGSDNVRAFALVHAEGRHTSLLRGGAIGESGGHLSYGSFAGKSIGQSDLSKSVAPPMYRSVASTIAVGCAAASAALFIAFVTGFEPWISLVLGLGVVAVIVLLEEPRREWNRDEYPKLLADWKASFLCQRCGTRFRMKPTSGR